MGACVFHCPLPPPLEIPQDLPTLQRTDAATRRGLPAPRPTHLCSFILYIQLFVLCFPGVLGLFWLTCIDCTLSPPPSGCNTFSTLSPSPPHSTTYPWCSPIQCKPGPLDLSQSHLCLRTPQCLQCAFNTLSTSLLTTWTPSLSSELNHKF